MIVNDYYYYGFLYVGVAAGGEVWIPFFTADRIIPNITLSTIYHHNINNIKQKLTWIICNNIMDSGNTSHHPPLPPKISPRSSLSSSRGGGIRPQLHRNSSEQSSASSGSGGNIRRERSNTSESSNNSRRGCEFGDLSRGISERAKEGALNYTGKASYKFGDLSRTMVDDLLSDAGGPQTDVTSDEPPNRMGTDARLLLASLDKEAVEDAAEAVSILYSVDFIHICISGCMHKLKSFLFIDKDSY